MIQASNKSDTLSSVETVAQYYKSCALENSIQGFMSRIIPLCGTVSTLIISENTKLTLSKIDKQILSAFGFSEIVAKNNLSEHSFKLSSSSIHPTSMKGYFFSVPQSVRGDQGYVVVPMTSVGKRNFITFNAVGMSFKISLKFKSQITDLEFYPNGWKISSQSGISVETKEFHFLLGVDMRLGVHYALELTNSVIKLCLFGTSAKLCTTPAKLLFQADKPLDELQFLVFFNLGSENVMISNLQCNQSLPTFS